MHLLRGGAAKACIYFGGAMKECIYCVGAVKACITTWERGGVVYYGLGGVVNGSITALGRDEGKYYCLGSW